MYIRKKVIRKQFKSLNNFMEEINSKIHELIEE